MDHYRVNDDNRCGTNVYPRLVEQFAKKPNGDRRWFLITDTGEDRHFDPLASIADAWELEGMVPEEKRHAYMLNLAQIVWPKRTVGTAYPHISDVYDLRRATPRQISTAVWEVCCK